MTDISLRQEFHENFQEAQNYWEPYVKAAEIYTQAASGKTWTDAELMQLRREGREPLEFNIIRRPLSFFSGWMRDNLSTVIYTGVEGSDEETADQFTKLSYEIWEKNGGYSRFLDAGDEMFKSGMSLCGIQMDYSRDFINGDISFYKRTYNSFYLDPTFENIDLSDCGYAITRDILSKEIIGQLLPFVDKQVREDIPSSFKDNKFMSFSPRTSSFGKNNDMVAYDQYYRRTTANRKYLIDLDSGFHRDITDLPREDHGRLKQGIKRIRDTRKDADIMGLDINEIPNIEIRTVERPFIELNIMLNGVDVYKGEDRTGITEYYPFAPLLCHFEPSIWLPSHRVQGMAATQYSAQRQFNKRHMKIIDMMDSAISTGYKYIVGSVDDPQDLQQSGANRLIAINPDAPEGTNSVQELQGGGANPALIEYQNVLDNLSLTLGNVTEASLGMDEKRNTLVSGRLAQVQIAQNLKTNRKVFDNIDTAQQVIGKLVLLAIQKNYPPAKVARILNEEPTEQFYDGNFEQFDAVIKEGVRSKTQRDAYYYELVNLKREGIVDVPQSEIIRSLSMAGITDLKKAIDAQEQARSDQQAKIDEQERLAMELANSQVEANLATASERKSRERSNLGLEIERISEAAENRSVAALNRAKTISEIASMNEERIIKVLEFVNQLEQQESLEQDKILQREDEKVRAIEGGVRGAIQNELSKDVSSLMDSNLDV